ncbi:MAG: tetratricopeptide repeat protein [Chloroflexota bacterium]
MTRSFKLLGTLEIAESGRFSPLMKSAKGCALLTYLLVTNQSQTRAHIADLLWEATSTADSLRNLRRLLHTVRKAIPELIVTRQTLSFQPTDPVTVDYLTVRTALEQNDLNQLDQGLKHYHGDLLEGFYLDDAPYFNEWLSLTREQFRTQVTDAYYRLCTYYGEQHDWQAGISATRRWLQLDDLQEVPHRQLIQFLAANGQLTEAKQQYETLSSRLMDELGVEPEEATSQLISQIIAIDSKNTVSASPTAKWQPSPLPDSDTLAAPGALPPHAFLPYQRNDDFTGRETDLITLARHLLPWNAGKANVASSDMVALSGMGGLGKTQLAVEFAYRYGRFYEGGIYWLSFAQANNVPEEIANVGGERGMKLFKEADQLTVADQAGRVQQTWQAATPRLLIFDNCEDEELLKQWLPVTGGCRVLLTTRRNIWSRELGIILHPLDKLERQESLALLQQLAPDAIALDQATMEKIAAELGDLPLALHLAGSFLARYKRITPERYLAQLRQIGLLKHPSLQGRGISYSPTGHELHVARTFAITNEQFQPDNPIHEMAQQLLQHAACFSPGETIPRSLLVATVLTGVDDDDLMAELLAEDGIEHLLTLGFLAGKGNALTMHPLVAAFVQENLANMPKIYGVVITAVLRLITTQQQTMNSLFALSIPTSQLRYLTEWGLKEPTSQVATLANLFGQHLIDRQDYDGALAFLQQTLPLHKQLSESNRAAVAQNLIHLGTAYVRKSSFEQGRAHFQQAIAQLTTAPADTQQELGQLLLGQAYSRLSEAHSKMGNFAEALEANQQALTIYEETEGFQHLDTANCLRNRGTIFIEMGDFEQAQAPYEQAIASFQQILGSDSSSVARIQGNLGWIYMQVGRYTQARQTLEEAFATLEGNLGPEHQYTLSVLHSLGQLYYERGNYAEAEATLTKGVSLRQKLMGNVHHTTAFMQTDLGIVLRETERFEEAEPLLQAALDTRKQIYGEEHPWTVQSFNHLGKLYLEMGSFEKAAVLLQQAWELNQKHNPEYLSMADSLDLRGDLLAKTERLAEAKAYWEQSRAIRENLQGATSPKLAPTLNRLARWQLEMGDLGLARELAETAVSLLQPAVTPHHRELIAAQEIISAANL